MRIFSRRFWLLLSLPLAILIIGTIGFSLLEGLSPFDAFYFTLVTVSTVGYGDIHPTTIASKVFSIILIIFGIGTFLTIVTTATQMVVQQGQDKIRRRRLNMLIGVFFTEVGNELLRMLTGFDPNVDKIRDDCSLTAEWSEGDYETLVGLLAGYQHAIDPARLDLDMLYEFLTRSGDLLLRQLENSDLTEHESFTELLWAIVHMRDELMARKKLNVSTLPESDRAHLANDVRRVYRLLTRQWLEYLRHLRTSYPYLFSLALRTNPFSVNLDVIVD